MEPHLAGQGRRQPVLLIVKVVPWLDSHKHTVTLTGEALWLHGRSGDQEPGERPGFSPDSASDPGPVTSLT